jgi:hypothetical protein
MRDMFKKFMREESLLKKLRLVLITTLASTVIISAALAIFMIVSGVANETLFKVTGTFALLAGFSLIILLQTSSLYREELLDKLISITGFISSFVIALWGLDSIWSWNIMAIIFGDSYELLGKTMSVFGFTIALTLIAGLLRSSLKINVKIKMLTFFLASLYYALWQVRIWFPEWFSEEITETYLDSDNNEQTYTYMQEIGFWSDTFLILGILLGTMLVISLVNHILGGKKQKTLDTQSNTGQLTDKKDTSNGCLASDSQTEARDGQAYPKSLSNIQLSDEVYAKLEELAKKEGITVSELVSRILKATYDKN